MEADLLDDVGDVGPEEGEVLAGSALDRCPRCSRTGPPGSRGLLPVYMCIYIGNSLSYSSPKTKTKSPLISMFTMQAYASRGSLPTTIQLLACCFLPSPGSIPTTQALSEGARQAGSDQPPAGSRQRSSEVSPDSSHRDAGTSPCPWIVADGSGVRPDLVCCAVCAPRLALAQPTETSVFSLQVCSLLLCFHLSFFLPQTNPY
jgi:hypothetical protein